MKDFLLIFFIVILIQVALSIWHNQQHEEKEYNNEVFEDKPTLADWIDNFKKKLHFFIYEKQF